MMVESSVSRMIVESSTFRTFNALGGVSIHDGMTRAEIVVANRREVRICFEDRRILSVFGGI